VELVTHLRGATFTLGLMLYASMSNAADCRHTDYGEPRHMSISNALGLTNSPRWKLICRDGYQAAFNFDHNVADWVAMHLRREDLVQNPGEEAKRDDIFRPDPLVPETHRVVGDDYKYSGYHRGHLAPAASMKRSQQVMNESFFMTNMAPQVGAGFNSGIWKALERRMRWWACERDELYIISGPLYETRPIEELAYDEDGDGEDDNGILVHVPSHFFKIAYDPRRVEAIGFLLPNSKQRTADLDTFIKSIDAIEARSQLDVLTDLPDQIEAVVEAAVQRQQWHKPSDDVCSRLK